jgi:ribose transport system permease protein
MPRRSPRISRLLKQVNTITMKPQSSENPAVDAEIAPAAGRLRSLSVGLQLLRIGPLLILILMIIVISLLTPLFLLPRNLSNVLAQTAVIATLALGQYVVIVARGIDLSVGSSIALCTVIGATVFHALPDLDPTLASILVIACMLATGAAIGAVNGAVYVYGRLPHPFIITLATLSICKGMAYEISHGQNITGVAAAVQFIGHTQVLGVPFSVLVSTYVISGLCAAIAAIIVAGRTNSGSGLLGDLGELDSIASVIIGGASFLGGRGNVGQAIVGALMIGVMRNGLNLLNVSIFFQLIVIGVVIVLAVESDVLRAHLENRFRVLQAASAA